MNVQTTLTASEEVFAQALEVIPGGVNSSTRALNPALIWRKAEGVTLEDIDGKKYVDYHAAFGPIVLGHNDPDVNQSVVDALSGPDLIGVGTTEIEVQLAAKLNQHIPSADKVLLCNSGSEATFNALRLARAVTGRKKIIKFQGCYHGWHDYVCMNVISPAEKIGQYDFHSAGMLEEAALQTLVLPFNRLEAVEAALQEHRGQVAAIILEPIPHNIGCVLPVPNFLQGLRELATVHGTVLIFDEVITGFRHGLGGFQKYAGVTPDLTTIAKSMANGYPIAALCGLAEFMDRFQTNRGDVFFAGTYNGHPVGVAAALATIKKMESGQVHEHTFRLGAYFAEGLQGILDRTGVCGHVVHFGSVVVPYFREGVVQTYTDLLDNNSALDTRFRREMVQRGFFLLPMALKRNHISAAHTQEHVDQTLESAEAVLKAIGRA
jgi:glutamate-1-semialdehyde 2,1-aminomutase